MHEKLTRIAMNYGIQKMKILSRFGLLAILATTWVATAAFAAGPSYRLKVAGLACPFCAYGIEKKLNAVKGVERVQTNIKGGVVVVRMKDGAKLNAAVARQAVKDAGFTLHGFALMSSGGNK
jgi:mercuric ion binding protein